MMRTVDGKSDSRKLKSELLAELGALRVRLAELEAGDAEWQRSALQQSEEKYRAIFEASTDAVFLETVDGRILDCNAAACDMFGYGREELIGLMAADLVPEEVAASLPGTAGQALKTGGAFFETLKKKRDGQVFACEVSARPIAFGGEQRVIVYVRDVSTRKQLEQQSEKRHVYLESVLACAPDAIVTLDAQHRILEWNQGAERLFGYSREEAVGQELDSLIAASDARILDQATGFTRQALDTEPVLPTETIRYRKDGRPIDVIVAASPILIQNDLAGVVAVYTDITERRQIEEKIKRRSEELANLNAISTALGQSLDLQQVLTTALERSLAVMNAEEGIVYLASLGNAWPGVAGLGKPDEAGLTFAPAIQRGLPSSTSRRLEEFKLGEGLCGQAAKTGESLLVPDLTRELGSAPAWVIRQGWRSLVCVSLRAGGRTVGVMALGSRRTDGFAAGSLGLLTAIGQQVGVAVENARLHEQVQARSLYLETMQRIGATLRGALPLKEVLDTIVRGTGQALNYVGALIALPDAIGARLQVGAAWGDRLLEAAFAAPGSVQLETLSLPLTVQENPIARAYVSSVLQVWSGAPEQIVAGVEPAVGPDLALAVEHSMGAGLAVCVPLSGPLAALGGEAESARNGAAGVLVVFSPRWQLPREERVMLLGLADQAGLAIETARRFEETERLKAFNEGIVQSMAEGIAVQDAEGYFTFVNPAMAAILGYEPQDLCGQPGAFVVPPDQQPIIDAANERRAQGQADRYEIELLRRDGTRLPVLISGSPRFDGSGRFVGTLAVFSDISERVRAEEATARRAREMAALYETSLAINAQPDIPTLLQAIVERAVGLSGARMGSLYLVRPGSETCELVVSHNLPGDWVGTVLNLGEGLSGRVAQTGQPMMIDDHRHWDGRAAVYHDSGFRRVLAVPLKVQDRVVGVIDVADDEKVGPFNEEEIRLVSLFADQAAIALENARLFSESQRRMQELAGLYDTALATSGVLETEVLLGRLYEQVQRLFAPDAAVVGLYDLVARDIRLPLAMEGGRVIEQMRDVHMPLNDGGLMGWVIRSGQSLLIGDLETEAAPALSQTRGRPVRTWLGVPLMGREGAIGAISVQSFRPRVYDENHRRLLESLAGPVATALENARLFEERARLFQAEHEQRVLAEALRRATAAVGSTLDLDQVLDRILEQVGMVIGGDASNIMLVDGEITRFVRWWGYDDMGSGMQSRENPAWSVALRVTDMPTFRQMLETGKPLVLPDTETQAGWVRVPETAWVRSYAGAPIVVRGEVVGFLSVDSALPGFFKPSHADPLQAFADSASIAIENARLYEETVNRNRELALLNRVMAASTASQEIEPILEVVCNELAWAFDLPVTWAALFDESESQVTIVAEHISSSAGGDWPSVKGRVFLAEQLEIPAFQHVIEQQAPLLIADAQTDEYLAVFRDQLRRAGITSLALLPLVVGGKTVGALGLVAAAKEGGPGVAWDDGRAQGTLTVEQVGQAWRVAGQVSSTLARVRLAKTQQRLSTVMEQSAELVVITDTKGMIVYVNPAFERVTGYSRAEAIGQNPRLLKSGKHDEVFYHNLWQTIISDQVWTGRFINRKKDGSLYTEDATISPVHNQAGEIINYVAVKRDVTREVQLEEQVRQSQKMEAMGRLAGGIAHDFNNLLTVIQVSGWLLQRQMRPEDPLWEYVQRIQETVERATRLVKQLLSFSRRQIIEPRAVNLSQVVGDLGHMLQRIIGEDIRLTTKLASDLWPANVDPTQIEQVIMNLVVNARDAMPGGGMLSIETANVILDEAYAAYHVGAQPGEHVLLAISDTGVGMSDEVKAHVFEPFFTTKERGQGTGLGLSTVFGIVNQNKGYVWVYSEVGQGTTFKIYIPRMAAPDVTVEQPPTSYGRDLHQGIAPTVLIREERARDDRPETVLVVEDEQAVRELVVRILSAHGYQVLEAQDGSDALQVGEQHSGSIDLLLTDMVMPRMNGKELAGQMCDRRPGMRVLFISGYTDNVIAQQGMLDPGVTLLPKPFTMEDLLHKVRNALDSG